MHTGFMFYSFFVTVFSIWMIYKVAPMHGTTNPLVYLSICSLVGSISVMAIKGLGVALKLTFAGNNQLTHLPTYVFAIVVGGCIAIQMNYFNKALDTFSTNVWVRSQLSIFPNLNLFCWLQGQSYLLCVLFVSNHPCIPPALSRLQYVRGC